MVMINLFICPGIALSICVCMYSPVLIGTYSVGLVLNLHQWDCILTNHITSTMTLLTSKVTF